MRQGLIRGWVSLAVAVVLLSILQALLGQSAFFVNLAALLGVNVILAVSLNIVNGLTGQFSIGHAGFMAIGAYVAAKFSLLTADLQIVGLPEQVSDQLIFTGSLLLGGALAASFGFLVGLPTLRLRGDYLAIVTLGFGEIIRVVVQNSEFFGRALGLSGIPQRTTLFSIGLWTFLAILVARRITQSVHGRSLLAIREDEVAAESMGVPTTAYKVRAFVVAAFFAGIAGGLFAHIFTINPGSFSFVKSMEIVVMVVLGGLGSTTGAIVAAVGLTLLPEVLRSAFNHWATPDLAQKVDQIRMPLYGVLLVVLMVLRPQGLFGTHEIWDLPLFRKRRKKGTGYFFGDSASGGMVESEKVACPPFPARVLLEARGVSIVFGGLKALTDFNLKVRQGELLGLIGPNGAGKSTAFNVLTGVYRPTHGEVRVGDDSVNGRSPHLINRAGVARTFQNIRLFKALSAIDNVKVACLAEAQPLFSRDRVNGLRRNGHRLSAHFFDATNNYYDWWRALLLSPGFQREEDAITHKAEELLSVMGLEHRRDELAKNLPYGEQRRLEIARALGTGPKVLLLDEPAAGMNSREKVELMGTVRHIKDRFGLGILVIEHDMKLVMGICERITVLDHGETIAVGTGAELRSHPKVIEAYLGGSYAQTHAVGAAR